MKISVIITAGGSSVRYGKDKLLETINGKTVIECSVNAFLPLDPREIIISASEKLEKEISDKFKHIKNLKITRGGKTRQDSVFNALKACTNPDFVCIHDAARPLIKIDNIKSCLEKAIEKGAAITAVKATDTIKKVDKNGKIIETPDRDTLWCVQTPQIFKYKTILAAHEKLFGKSFSDDAGMLEFLGFPVYIDEGDYSNIKITTPKDILLAELLINSK